jgi:hypothetical protein
MPGGEEESVEIAAVGETRKARKLYQPTVVYSQNIQPAVNFINVL